MKSDDQILDIIKSIKMFTWVLIFALVNLLVFMVLLWVVSFSDYTIKQLGGLMFAHASLSFISFALYTLDMN